MTTPRSSASLTLTRQLAVKVSADGRNVENALTGDPFFWLGDTAWETFHRLDKEEATLYLKNRASKGFNVVMMVIMAEHGGLDYPSRAGEWPFLPSPESTAEKYVPDVSKPNPAYFDLVDWVVEEAAKLGILVALVPTWGRYMNYGYYPQGPLIFDEENIKALGAYVGERYPHQPFILGGDSNRYWNQNTITTIMSDPSKIKDLEVNDSGAITEALAASLAAGIAKADGSIPPFMTYHPAACWLPGTAPATSGDFFPESEWLSMDIIQSGHIDVKTMGLQGDARFIDSWDPRSSVVPVRRMYDARTKEGKPRPVMDSEGHYESTNYGFSYDAPLWNAADIRNGAFQAVFAGACGITYGVNSIWQMHNASSKTHPPIAMPTTAQNDWHTELNLPGSYQVAHLRNLIISLPSFAERVPAQEIILSNKHEGEGDKLVSALRSSKDLWALIYTPEGEPVKTAFEAHEAQWFDPRTGKRQAAVQEKGVYTPPTSGSIEEDWCLVLLA